MYRNEWDCCGGVTETDAYVPDACPFCLVDTLTEQVRALTAAIEAHKRVSHGDAGYLGNPDVASDLRLWAILPTPPKEAE